MVDIVCKIKQVLMFSQMGRNQTFITSCNRHLWCDPGQVAWPFCTSVSLFVNGFILFKIDFWYFTCHGIFFLHFFFKNTALKSLFWLLRFLELLKFCTGLILALTLGAASKTQARVTFHSPLLVVATLSQPSAHLLTSGLQGPLLGQGGLTC